MADKTAIEWTDATWSPVSGCSKVSPGCASCYAETVARRFPDKFTDDGVFRPWHPKNSAHNVLLHPDRLDQPLRWRRPRMVFVCSVADLFHEIVPDEYIARVFAVMARASQHTFQVLTKRPDRMRELLNDQMWWTQVGASLLGLPVGDVDATWYPDAGMPVIPNVWLGTTIENRRYVARADDLRATPAAMRFISAEPLLGPLVAPVSDWYVTDLGYVPGPGRYAGEYFEGLRDAQPVRVSREVFGPSLDLERIDWLIVGGESGHGARPMRAEWARDLIAAGAASGTAVFVKQLGVRLAREHGVKRKGGDMAEWPSELADLRVREFPTGRLVAGV